MTTDPTVQTRPSLGARAAVMLVSAYQFGVRPFLVGNCKFYPTCSAYMIEALQMHGLWRGGWMGLRRLARCHPFTPGGIDPVPDPQDRD